MHATKHLGSLDGLRGVAAIAVVFTHAATFMAPLSAPSGSLAVDLFFMLSGYVLYHAYADRLAADMTAARFMALRMLRLAPLYYIGALLALMLFAMSPADGARTGLADVMAVVALFTMMPSPFPNRYGELFALNGPRWSLFFELAVNLTMVGLLRAGLGARSFALIAFGLAAATIYAIVTRGTIEFGWDRHSFLLGFCRAGSEFFIGVLLCMVRGPTRMQHWIGYVIPVAVVPVLFLRTVDHPFLIVLAVYLVFPAIIVAGARMSAGWSGLNDVLGAISYPLYVIHVPIFGLVAWGLRRRGMAPADVAPWLGLAVAGMAIGISWWLAVNFDAPLRRTMIGRLMARRRNPAA